MRFMWQETGWRAIRFQIENLRNLRTGSEIIMADGFIYQQHEDRQTLSKMQRLTVMS